MARIKQKEPTTQAPHHAAFDGAAPTAEVVGETAGGKVISIHQARNGRLCYVTLSGGGTFPPALSGSFTSRTEARFVVDAYLASQVNQE